HQVNQDSVGSHRTSNGEARAELLGGPAEHLSCVIGRRRRIDTEPFLCAFGDRLEFVARSGSAGLTHRSFPFHRRDSSSARATHSEKVSSSLARSAIQVRTTRSTYSGRSAAVTL